jgi:Flp pilus assembly protein TadD
MENETPPTPPSFAEGLTLHQAGRLAEAEEIYRRVVRTQPDRFEARHLLGVVLLQRGEPARAVEELDAALSLNPDDASALNNRGSALHDLNRFEEAVANYDRALALQPGFAEALSNRGVALQELKRFDEALADFGRAILLRPDDVKTHVNEMNCRLLIGDFEHGWRKLEWIWQHVEARGRVFRQPVWLGPGDIAGKIILLHAELGFGDTIQFCRYVPLVAARGAYVVLQVQPPLQELMTSLDGAAQVVSRGEPLPRFDVHCPLLSLPLAFGTRLETIPATAPYLHASPEKAKLWAGLLGPRPRIGLVWSGEPTYPHDRNRSMPFRSLLPLLDVAATFVSLQKDVRATDAPDLAARSDVLDCGGALNDFSDTAAIMSNLDLIISVDTSVAHLAGALAMPVWIMLPFVPPFRWLLDRDDCPWYPTARLFRQNETRTWDDVVARVRAALIEFIGTEAWKRPGA